MARRFFKSITLGIIVFAAAVLVGYLSYVITYRYQMQRVDEAVMPHAADTAEAAPASGNQSVTVDYYLARLENRDIAVYMVSDGQETFLYRLGVYTANLPAEDLLRLKEGVVLRTRQELTSFEEDYTS